MKGRRIQADENGWLNQKFEPGDYGKADPKRMEDGNPLPDWVQKQYPFWMACTPNGHLGNLADHQVTEHEDGSITVSPSILIRDGKGVELWHGWLERGVWRSC